MSPDRWRRVEELYHAARERDVTLRAVFLHEACAGDNLLRQEVERLLAAGEKPTRDLESPIQQAAARMFEETPFEETPTQSLVGRQLGAYQVLAKIGEGGMGEVYRALDTKLRRDVALKVLPKPFARDPERLARFRREAQLLASLNHKNVAAIYGFEETAEVNFLVLELVDGETFAERIKRSIEPSRAREKAAQSGGLPLKDALTLAGQVAEGLEAAHRKGITHRDIKPANIKVTPEGEVKVLDFGLAKAFAGDRANADLSDLPTREPGPTKDGQILGTPAYMSPGQVRGQEVDKRTDIWAFGCVLYELLTGQRPFPSRHPSRDRKGADNQSPDRQGGDKGPVANAPGSDSLADIISSVLNDEPDWSALPAETPASIRTLLRRCLQKDANRRLHDIADARIEIEEALAAPATAEATAVPVVLARPPWRRVMPWSMAFVVALIVTTTVVWNLKPAPPQPVIRTAINLPPGQRLAALEQPAIAISPDGKNLVYVAIQSRDSNEVANLSPDRQGGGTSPQQLYLRPLDSLEAKPIVGTEGAVAPFFSPDGQWVGFFAGGKLKKVSVNGGAAVTLATTPFPGGASWSSLGTVAFQPAAAASQGLLQVSQEGGTPRPLTMAGNEGGTSHAWPEFLPGGKALLFASPPIFVFWNNAQIAVQAVGIGERKNLAQGTQPHYAATGHLLYAQGGTLMAAPFDAQRLALTGAAVPALEGVMQSTATGASQYGISSTGTLVYLAGGLSGTSSSRMIWVSRKGEEQLLPTPPHNYLFPRLSPDGYRVAVAIAEQETQIWVYDISRDTLTRLTFEGTTNNAGVWSPDGKRIAFGSNRVVPYSLFWQASDGSGGAERLTASDYTSNPNSFSPDGQLLAFVKVPPETGRDIWVLNLRDGKEQPFLKTPYEETAPKFSPDGNWLAYSSDESGRREIYVQPYPGPGGKWQVSTEGGQEPVWNPKGGELFYRSGSKIMAVDDTQSGFSAGKPRMLFEGPYLPTSASYPYYDVSPDGQRFLMLKPSEQPEQAATQINVVLNWFEELKRRVPSGR